MSVFMETRNRTLGNCANNNMPVEPSCYWVAFAILRPFVVKEGWFPAWGSGIRFSGLSGSSEPLSLDCLNLGSKGLDLWPCSLADRCRLAFLPWLGSLDIAVVAMEATRECSLVQGDCLPGPSGSTSDSNWFNALPCSSLPSNQQETCRESVDHGWSILLVALHNRPNNLPVLRE